MSERIKNLEEKVDKVDEKLDKIVEKISSIDVTLAVNTESLVQHIKRTNLLEEQLRPVSKHVAMMEGAFKVIGILASVAAFAVGIAKMIF